jgi:hypothetical protein
VLQRAGLVIAATVGVVLATSMASMRDRAGASSTTLTVGPGLRYRRPCQAIMAARPGDTIAIEARGNGTYNGDVCAWSTSHLTIEGVGGRAHIDADGASSQGKATWVIAGNDTRIENVELSGARAPDGNGAGIRQEGANLTLVHCYFRDNQDGILTAPNPASTIVIDSSVFADNGTGTSYTHNIYIGQVRSFIFRYSYATDARAGHLLKSRALRNYILYSRLSGENGTDSYELDLPNGGLSYVIGTVIQQGRRTENPNMLAYGEEGALNPDSHLYVVNDTFVNDLGDGAALFIASGVAPVLAENDLSTGSPTFVTQRDAVRRHNCLTSSPGFVDPARYDYRLTPASPCLHIGRRPGSAQGSSLAPTEQYVYRTGHRMRTDSGRVAGAFGRVRGRR